jgi:micrococcal nuclease
MKYKKVIAIVCVALFVCACVYYVAHAALTISIDPDTLYPVTAVMDGDTFKAKIGWHTVTVRMLGIDTPETVDPRKPEQCYGKEASDETKGLLFGRSVRLELNPDREVKDKYDRYLAYIYLEDETFLNEYLLENGFAREYTYGKPYIFQDKFRSIEKEAKEKKIGLWGVCGDTSFRSTKP